MIDHEHNSRLVHRYLLLRYNITVTIGICVRIIAPHLIIKEVQVVTLVCSDAPALMMTTPNVFTGCIINNDIEGNKYGVTILNNTTLGICRTQEMQIKCTGEYCNHQRPHEMLNQGYGLWGT